MLNALRGFHDILPPENERFFYFMQVADDTAKNFGFSKVNLPILEEKALFCRCVGESSDIVGKEMYDFTDKGENEVCMRPEGTAGAVRAFIETKLDRAGGIHRWSYFGPMFRYERPQKGRLRQFHQFGIESFGEASVYEDAQIIMLAFEIFNKLGIKSSVSINSLGCPECAPNYRQKLIEFASALELCDDCKRRLVLNPLRILDCKNEACKRSLANAPKITDCLCSSCDDDFKTLQNVLATTDIEFKIDKNLVRGLDYYTKTAFEFTADTGGSQNAIAGGGRYDNLVSKLGGKQTPAVGMAIGVERILELIQTKEASRAGYYVGAMDDVAMPTVFTIAAKLRNKGAFALLSSTPRGLKGHLKNADRANAMYCVVVGENELNTNSVWIKNMQDGTEQSVAVSEIVG